MQHRHDFWDGSREVPPVNVEHINVARLEFLETPFQAQLQAFGMVSLEVTPDTNLPSFLRARIIRCKLGRNDHLISIPSFSHPFPNPGLGFLALVAVGGIDKIAAASVEIVQYSECLSLVAFS